MSGIVTTELACGAVLLVEPIPSTSSAAISWMLPVGAAADPVDGDGQSAMLSEFIFRGAGGMTSREHSDALDRMGVHRSSHTGTRHMHLEMTLLGDRLLETQPLLVTLVREPAFPDDAVDPIRSLCLQSLESLDDEPQHLAMIHLREQHLPPPLGRSGYGQRSVLESVTGAELRRAWGERCVPRGSIIALAGAVDPPAVIRDFDRRLAGWEGEAKEPEPSGPAARGARHSAQDAAQVHIGLAYDAPRESDEHSMHERLATYVLSGSTSGRLFSEVRQKRSLCYAVSASYRAGRDRGHVALYAGTTPERAQETLDVCVAEIERLFGGGGVSGDEFQRARTGLKSRLVMQGESTPARAAALASDYDRLGRSRSLDEVARAIDEITLDALNAYVEEREIGEWTLVTVGSTALEVPGVTA